MTKINEGIITDLKKNQYVFLDSDIPFEQFEELVKHYLTFTKKSEEYKNMFKYLIPTAHKYGNDKGIELGQFHKLQKRGDQDDKEYFHFNPKLIEKLDDSIIDKEKAFFTQLETIYNSTHLLCKKVFRELDKQYNGIYDLTFDSNGNSNSTLRVLKYKTQKVEEFSAKGHFDKGIATFSLAESCSGLRVGKDRDSLKEVSYQRDKLIFFPSSLISNYTNNDLMPTWHDVIQKRDLSKEEEEYTRWAVVLFVDPLHLDVEITFEQTHGL